MSSGSEKETKQTPREIITPLEQVIASTIAAAPAGVAPLVRTGWVYAQPQCVGSTTREWTVFARHDSGHGVMGRGPTAEAAIKDANAKALLAVPPNEEACEVVFEVSETAEQQRDNAVSYLKGVMADRLQNESSSQSNDWKKGFNEGCLFLLEKLESLGNN